MTQAYKISVGDQLSHEHPTELGHQVVLDVSVASSNGDLIIKTTHNTYRLKWSDDLTLPRRANGLTRDFSTEGVTPFSDEIYPGDILQPFDEWVDDTPQRVTAVRTVIDSKTRIPFIYITVYPLATYKFTVHQPVEFPAAKTAITSTDRPEAPGTLVFFGPYQQEETGALFMFAKHPHGRGRWSHNVRVYDPELPALPDGRAYECRFPANEWTPGLRPTKPGLPVGRSRGPVRRRANPEWTFS